MDVAREARVTGSSHPESSVVTRADQEGDPAGEGDEWWPGAAAVVAGSGHWREMCSHAGDPAPCTAPFLLEVPPEHRCFLSVLQCA